MSDEPNEAPRIDAVRIAGRVIAVGGAAGFLFFGVVIESWGLIVAVGCFLAFSIWMILTGRG
jgi:hypothetical protein